MKEGSYGFRILIGCCCFLVFSRPTFQEKEERIEDGEREMEKSRNVNWNSKKTVRDDYNDGKWTRTSCQRQVLAHMYRMVLIISLLYSFSYSYS
jgi:hypothetical protein